MRRRTFCLTLISAAPRMKGASDEDVVVGFLENLKEMSFAVRVAFRKQAGEWKAFLSDFADVAALKTATREFPGHVDWTVAWSGKALGHITSSTPASWPAYSEVGRQQIPADATIPHEGAKAVEFERWDSNAPLYRPLILVSMPNVEDPNQWKPIRLDPTYLKQAMRGLRDAMQKENSRVVFKESDVKPVRALGSKSGRVLFALTVRLPKHPDEVPGAEQSLHWFAAGGGDAVKFLGSELTYLDAGDYDHDGASEVVFMKSSYDRNGYVLFFDNFRHSVEFSWIYH